MTTVTKSSELAAPKQDTVSAEQIVLSAYARLVAAKNPGVHRLRRGTQLVDAMLEPLFYDIKQRLAAQGHKWVKDENLGCALLLAPLLKKGSLPLGAALAKAKFSSLRFNQLLACNDPAELFTAMQRALRQIDGAASSHDVLRIALSWTEYGADATRKRLLAKYFALDLPPSTEPVAI
jgi:hypothetical protein